MLKKIILGLLMSIFLLVGVVGFSHPGALDNKGGHKDKKTGKYHYHKKKDNKTTKTTKTGKSDPKKTKTEKSKPKKTK
ncbi:MAG: YHYH domain-containing protein [Spirochaetota bacterium]|nr:YHYH domain-containing protein [Spirochaetota bacterium]